MGVTDILHPVKDTAREIQGAGGMSAPALFDIADPDAVLKRGGKDHGSAVCHDLPGVMGVDYSPHFSTLKAVAL